MNTVFGVVADQLGHASASGQHWSSPAADYLPVQAHEIRVDQDHDHRWVGSIHYLARHHGRLWAVGEVGDEVVEAIRVRVEGRTVSVPNPLYWSATRIGGPGEGMLLESISLTPSPARICPQRVRFLPGRLDHREAAKRWRSTLDRAEYELLRRAAVARYERRKGEPIVIAELEAPQVTKLGRGGGFIGADGERLPAFQSRHADRYDDRRPPGKLRMRPCTIIAVR